MSDSGEKCQNCAGFSARICSRHKDTGTNHTQQLAIREREIILTLCEKTLDKNEVDINCHATTDKHTRMCMKKVITKF